MTLNSMYGPALGLSGCCVASSNRLRGAWSVTSPDAISCLPLEGVLLWGLNSQVIQRASSKNLGVLGALLLGCRCGVLALELVWPLVSIEHPLLKAHNGTKSDNARFLKGANYGSHGTLFDHVVSERQQIG